jgi:hypothetical protein
VSPASPWRRVLGDELEELHPRLSAYFSAIPAGRVGVGHGTFDSVGTPRRWLYPLLAILGRWGVVFPVWEHDVPFTVRNEQDGELLRARRTFHLRAGDRVMEDAIGVDRGTLVDRLGRSGSLRAGFAGAAVEGALRLESRGVTWRGIPVPFAPTVRLCERFDEAAGRQHVELTLDAPVFGRLYGYSGHFDYAIEDA